MISELLSISARKSLSLWVKTSCALDGTIRFFPRIDMGLHLRLYKSGKAHGKGRIPAPLIGNYSTFSRFTQAYEGSATAPFHGLGEQWDGTGAYTPPSLMRRFPLIHEQLQAVYLSIDAHCGSSSRRNTTTRPMASLRASHLVLLQCVRATMKRHGFVCRAAPIPIRVLPPGSGLDPMQVQWLDRTGPCAEGTALLTPG